MAESEGGGENPLVWGVIAAVFILMVIGTYADRLNFLDSEGGGISASLVDSGTLEEGTTVLNKKETGVRQSPAGSIIGEQPKREAGEIVSGPVEAFGQNWYRVDYKDAPDGWVAAEDITSKVGLFRALNIFPIIFGILRPIGIILAIIFFVLIVFVVFKQNKVAKIKQKKKEVALEALRKREEKQTPIPNIPMGRQNLEIKEDEKLPPEVPGNLPTGGTGDLSFGTNAQEMTPTGPKNEKWEKVQKLMNSFNVGDWKQAIIESDIMLEEMLNKMGYKGDSIGDKLKQIEESDFVTLNKAWEAHKFRNHIAHRGMDFTFSKTEAERIIDLYKQVFEEFYYI